MVYVFIAMIILIFALIYPFKVRLRMFFDPHKNRLFYLMTLFGFIKIGAGYLTVKDRKLYEMSYKGKFKNLDLKEIRGQIVSLDFSIFKIIKNSSLGKLNIFIEVSTNELVPEVMIKALIDAVLGATISILKNANKGMQVNKYVISKKDGVNFQLAVDGGMRISIGSIIYTILVSKLKNKENNYARKTTEQKQN